MNTQNNQDYRDDAVHGEVLPPAGTDIALESGVAVALVRAEIDMQVATARQYPRSINAAINNILTLATLDEETATECIYALKRGGSEANPLMRAAMRVMPPAAALLAIKGAYVVAVAVMLAEAAPWLPLLTGVFAAICAWNAGQIVKLRKG